MTVEDDRRARIAKQRIALNIQERLKDKLTPAWGVDTGKLKASIRATINEQGDIIITMDDVGKYIEFGTPPHIITAKNGKSLHWKSGGKDVFAKTVNHPGTRPFPFIRSTFRNELLKIITDAYNKSFR